MDRIRELVTDSGYVPSVIGGCAVIATVGYHVLLRPMMPGSRRVRRDFRSDVVVLRQIGRGPRAPSMSPFPLKLETYLRMAEIPYENDHTSGMSPDKGKTPWISYNSEDISDSQFCLEYLNKKFNVNLNRHLSAGERALARAFRIMTEEHLYWALELQRYVYDRRTGWTFFKQQSDYPWLVLVLIARMARRQAWEGGLGRHTQEEVTMVTGQDYEALSTQIDDHPFLMGSQPCEEDCAIFGMLAQARWQLPGTPHEKFVTETYPNLAAYCERMKGRFWPDWDDCITHGGTKAATK